MKHEDLSTIRQSLAEAVDRYEGIGARDEPDSEYAESLHQEYVDLLAAVDLVDAHLDGYTFLVLEESTDAFVAVVTVPKPEDQHDWDSGTAIEYVDVEGWQQARCILPIGSDRNGQEVWLDDDDEEHPWPEAAAPYAGIVYMERA